MFGGMDIPKMKPRLLKASYWTLASAHGAVLLVSSDFNAGLAALGGNFREEEIVVVMPTTCLEDMSTHFLPVRKSWERNRRTC